VAVFFVADEHYSHHNIIKYCNRPFKDAVEMADALILNHNTVVKKNDVVFHLGDFAITNKWEDAWKLIQRLNGQHFFIPGSHDSWIKKAPTKSSVVILDRIHEMSINGTHIVLCHYPMRTWPKSHYGSWNLHGHAHGELAPFRNQYDVGVDNNNYYPISFNQIEKEMEE